MHQRILGQSRALETLESALRSGRTHHAWIFAGPQGVGKFTTAIEFAKILLGAEEGKETAREEFSLTPGPSPEGRGEKSALTPGPSPKGRGEKGRAARMIDEGTHPDLHIIRRDLAAYSANAELRRKKLSNIPIDLLREHMVGGYSGERYFEPKVFHSPRLASAKVFIIDEAELLDSAGQNSLLKTLEEPSKRTYIILITSQPDRLLPTIRSRAQRVSFLPLHKEAMDEWWKRSRHENGLPPDVREWVGRFAEGSPGMAAMALEDGLFEWRSAIEPILREAERGRFVAGAGEAIAKLVDSFAKAGQKEDENESKELANRDGARRVFLMMSRIARGRLRDATAGGGDPQRWLRTIDLIAEAEREIAANVNMKLVFEDLIAQWADGAQVAQASRL